MAIFCFNPNAASGGMVRVEVDIRKGLPSFDIVGLAVGSVRESGERLRVAMERSGLEFPDGRILVNLVPASEPKSGSAFDLAIAAAVNVHLGCVGVQDVLVMGELRLDGSLEAVPAVLPAMLAAARQGIRLAIVPRRNQREAHGVPGICARFADDLDSALAMLGTLAPEPEGSEATFAPPEQRASEMGFDLGAFRKRPLLGLALMVAAAGGHHILLYGPPGTGKTFALGFLGELLPSLGRADFLEVNRIHALAGLLPPGADLLRWPPVRRPHTSSSLESIMGGGKLSRPGELSLAHTGLLILDEACEFPRSLLQSLREPLESREVRVGRVDAQIRFPARTIVGISTNLCPCGQLGTTGGFCLCAPMNVSRYWSRLGAPLIDRFDLRVAMHAEGNADERGETIVGQDAPPWWKDFLATEFDYRRLCSIVATARRRQPDLFASLCGESLYVQVPPQLCDSAGEHPRTRDALLRLALTLACLRAVILDSGGVPCAADLDAARSLRRPVDFLPGLQTSF